MRKTNNVSIAPSQSREDGDGASGSPKSRRKFDRNRKRERSGRKVFSSVNVNSLEEKPFSPLVVTPKSHGIDFISWIRSNKIQLLERLHEHGAILFRGFDLGNTAAVSEFSEIMMASIFTENTEHQPVTTKRDVQVPVDYAKDKFLLWHNENTFNLSWPQKIVFACDVPARVGGETPLADSRTIYSELNNEVRTLFEHRKVMYVRRYNKDDNLGLGWKTIFCTVDKAVVEAKCRAEKMQFEWVENNALITKAVRPAVWRHPVTKEPCWINQAQHWHISCLDAETRHAIEALYQSEWEYPRNCFFGDGGRIPDAAMQSILDVYKRHSMSFAWQRGDLLFVDNVLKAHARNSFEGHRRILVCLGELGHF